MQLQTKRNVILLLSGYFLVYVMSATWRDFWYPDEPDVAEIVRQMLMRGDYIQLWLAGQPFNDYPPLFFWLSSSFARLFGLWELPMRMPAILAAVGVLAMTAGWCYQRFSSRVAFWSIVVLGSTYWFFWQAVHLHVDMVFTFFFSAAIFAYDFSRDSPRKRHWLLISAMAMGLAAMTKGPAGIVLPGAILFFDVVLHRSWQELRGLVMTGLGAIGIFALWSLTFAYLTAADNLWYFLYEQNVQRFLTGWSHSEPFYYYFPRILTDLLPWSPLFLLALPLSWHQAREGDRGSGLALVWFATIFMFFSISESKRGVYILPLYPAAAIITTLLICRWMQTGIHSRVTKTGLWVLVSLTVLVGGALAVTALFYLDDLKQQISGISGVVLYPLIGGAICFLIGGIVTLQYFRQRQLEQTFATLALAFVTGQTVILACLFPLLDDPFSAGEDARWLDAHIIQEHGHVLGVFHQRADTPKEATALSFYGDLPVEYLDTSEEIERYIQEQPQGMIVVEKDQVAQFRATTSYEWTPLRNIRIGSDLLTVMATQRQEVN